MYRIAARCALLVILIATDGSALRVRVIAYNAAGGGGACAAHTAEIS
jgi:hypothetical protein